MGPLAHAAIPPTLGSRRNPQSDQPMPDGNGAVTAHVVEKIADIPAATWDSLAGHNNPFVSHAFLNDLEETNCASNRAGWLPHHLVVEDTDGQDIPTGDTALDQWIADLPLREV